jgi:hypothetical protein
MPLDGDHPGEQEQHKHHQSEKKVRRCVEVHEHMESVRGEMCNVKAVDYLQILIASTDRMPFVRLTEIRST